MTEPTTWVPAWFALLVVGVPMGLAGVCFLVGHTLRPGDHMWRYRQIVWDRVGWFLLGASGMAAGLVAWWMYT